MCAYQPANKRKIINDPVHGFIKVSFEHLYDLIEHPYFQRLRRIKQLGLTSFVYPGATHTRFQHALGALYLTGMAIQVLRSKDIEISATEEESVLSAILLHDIGHGPFSHTLEESIIEDIHHEELSLLYMQALNDDFGGRLEKAIEIFKGVYAKQFLHQLVSGQLDMDRLDYLKRDSFFTGVTEGVIGSDRIVRMLNVVNDNLVIDYKGIYSIEKFLIARRLMYWQVYLHKTVLASEVLLLKLLKRAKELALAGVRLFCTPSLEFFLYGRTDPMLLKKAWSAEKREILDRFARLDDSDILASAKGWQDHKDTVLSLLSRNLVRRKLPRIEIRNEPFPPEYIQEMKHKAGSRYGIGMHEAGYLVHQGEISNYAYTAEDEQIQILFHGGKLVDIADASDMLDISVLSKNVMKFFLCYPKPES